MSKTILFLIVIVAGLAIQYGISWQNEGKAFDHKAHIPFYALSLLSLGSIAFFLNNIYVQAILLFIGSISVNKIILGLRKISK
jgi:hypothetical protein